MNLSGILGNKVQTTVESDVNTRNMISNETRQESVQLTPGQILSGKVVECQDGRVTLSIDHMQINAKVLEDVLLSTGRDLTFLVKNDASGQILLSPLLENISNTQSVMQALQAADLPITEENKYMVNAMMQEGLSVSRESLQMMFSHMQEVGLEQLRQAIGLIKMGIDVTPNHCIQYANYESLSHSLSQGIQDIMTGIGEAWNELASKGMEEKFFLFQKDVLSIFLPQNTDGIAQSEKLENAILSDKQPENATLADKQINDLGNAVASDGDAEIIKNADEAGKQLQQEAFGKTAGTLAKQLQEQLEPREINALREVLEKNGILPKEPLEQMKTEDFLKLVARQLENAMELEPQQRKALLEMTGGKAFLKLLQEQIQDKWTINPEEVGKDGAVKNLYHRLFETSEKLAKVFSNLGQGGTAESAANTSTAMTQLSSQVSQMQNNLEFMNQMNQLQTYVQLPIRFQGKNRNGDLYVYTNKKSLAKKDGNVTALLHLDMENLGTMDVFVAMQQNRVKTNFYVEDADTIDFLAENIHILDERLAARGYVMQAKVLQKEEMKSEGLEEGIMNTLLHKGTFGQVVNGDTKGFDVKA